MFATLKRFSHFVQNSGVRGLYNSKGYASLLALLCATVLLLSAIGNFIGVGTYRFAAAILFPAGYALSVLYMGQVSVVLVELVTQDRQMLKRLRYFQFFTVLSLVTLASANYFIDIYDYILFSISVLFFISNWFILIVLQRLSLILKVNNGNSQLTELIRLKLHRTALLMCLCAITGLVVVVLNSVILVNFNAEVSNAVAALVRIDLMFLTQLGSGIVTFVSSTMVVINKERSINTTKKVGIDHNAQGSLSDDLPIVKKSDRGVLKQLQEEETYLATESAEHSINWYKRPVGIDMFNYPTLYSVIDRRLYQMHFSIVLIASIFEYYVNETLFLTAYLSFSMLSVLIFGPRLDLVMQLIIRNRRVIANVGVLNDSYIDSKQVRFSNLMEATLVSTIWTAYFLHQDIALRVMLWAWFCQATLSGFEDISIGIILHSFLNSKSIMPRYFRVHKGPETTIS